MVLFDISLVWFTKAHSQIDISSCRGIFKKVVQQGRSRFGERSVLVLREYGKRARTTLVAFFNIHLIQFLWRRF